MIIARQRDLDKLISHMNNGLIKVIIGIRRCGKSYLLFEIFYTYLLEQGISKEKIIAVPLEDEEYAELNEPLKDLQKLLIAPFDINLGKRFANSEFVKETFVMMGRIIGAIVIGGVGTIIAVMGWMIWKKEKISLMHDYHVNKVSAENKPAFCRLSGIGLIVVGIGLLISAVILGLTDSVYSFLCFAVCFFTGLAMLIIAGVKYNR